MKRKMMVVVSALLTLAVAAVVFSEPVGACDETGGDKKPASRPVVTKYAEGTSGKKVIKVQQDGKTTKYSGYTSSAGVTNYRGSSGKIAQRCVERNGKETCK